MIFHDKFSDWSRSHLNSDLHTCTQNNEVFCIEWATLIEILISNNYKKKTINFPVPLKRRRNWNCIIFSFAFSPLVVERDFFLFFWLLLQTIYIQQLEKVGSLLIRNWMYEICPDVSDAIFRGTMNDVEIISKQKSRRRKTKEPNKN